MQDSVAQVNREELAWAAGFFDGEGSVCAKTRTGRDYSHLQFSVPQSGYEIPEVLIRFQAALLPIKSFIGGPYIHNDGRQPKWKLHIHTFEGVQAAVARLWPFLGTVKREQAAKALTAAKYIGRPHKSHCKWGHDIAIAGRDAKGYCIQCRRINNTRRKRRDRKGINV